MTSPLTAWESAQQRQLSAFRNPDSDRGVLVELLQTSCLLELSKLSPAQLDLGSYAQAVVEVISQFFPVDGSELRVEIDGLPPIRTSFGIVDEATSDILHQRALAGERAPTWHDAQGAAVLLGGRVVGTLSLWAATEALDAATFLLAASDHVSSTLSVVTEAERLRRQAAADTAMRLAASIDERSTDADLDALATAVAALPGATGAEIRVTSPLHTPQVMATAGLTTGEITHHAYDYERAGVMELTVWWVARPAPDDSRRLDAIVETLVHALARAERNRRLLEDAETDPLTGIANRRRISRELAAGLNRAERHGDFLGVIILDLDMFKAVNDLFGHDVGDKVLVGVANVLLAEARSYDVPARLGGDEFLVILPSTDKLGATVFADRVRARIEKTCRALLPDGPHVTSSVGVAVYPDDAGNGDDLLRHADDALYAAKRNGRNTVAALQPDAL